MSTTYERAPAEVERRGHRLMEKYHKSLRDAELRIDYAFAFNSEGDAVTMNGYPALTKCKVVGLKDRALGRGDVEIIIDGQAWADKSAAEQDALLDHELNHFELRKNKKGQVVLDDLGRPKLDLRKHDRQFGWFDLIAQRHGEAAFEVQQARWLLSEAREVYFQGEFEFEEGSSRIGKLEVATK